MNNSSIHTSKLPLQRQAIYNPSVSPSIGFMELKKEDIEQSIASRFEQQANKYPNSIAVKKKTKTLTYEQVNTNAHCLARAILLQQAEA